MDQSKWDIRFLTLAEHIAQWSKDPSSKIGAVIANGKDFISLGYNGFPKCVHDFDSRYKDREIKYGFIVHAEVNACLQAGRRANGATLYISPAIMSPPVCNECAKVVIQSGIKRIVSWKCETPERWEGAALLANLMLREAGITVDLLVKE